MTPEARRPSSSYSTTHGSGGGGGGGGHFSGRRKSRLQSLALTQAMSHVKEFMTDSQKALVLVREGKIYLDSGDIKGALDCFNQGISYHPSIALFNLRANCHKQMDLYKEAYFDYSFNIRLEPEVGGHYCNRGLCLARLRKAALALEDMDLAIRYDPNANHYYSRGTVCAEFGRHEQALSDFTMALTKEEGSTNNNNNSNNSNNIININNNINQEFLIKCRYRRALSAFELKRYEEVISDSQEILRLDAASVNARALMGRAMKILNQHQKAEQQLSDAILLDEHQPALYTERGDIRFRTEQKNKVIEAIYDFDKAVALLDAKLATRIPDNPIVITSKLSKVNLNLNNNNIANSGNSSSPVLGVTWGNSSQPSTIDLTTNRVGSPNDSQSRDVHSGSQSSSAGGRSAFSRQQQAQAFRPFNYVNRDRDDHLVSTTALYFRDIEEQLADTLYKRAQAKLILDSNPANISSALEDASRAASLIDEDDDYQLVTATCYIRLNDYQSATNILEKVLARSPRNHKALYSLAFCRRAIGSQREAIEGLTKIISMKDHGIYDEEGMSPKQQQQRNKHENTSLAAIPIHRVFEMRGTLFYEINAHKLALMDLGKAIAINPSNPGNYFLRGDCHSKLGNYEQALNDYNYAESKGFEDMCALLLSRGSVKRLLRDIKGAASDFATVYDLIPEKDVLSRARILSFRSFCEIDLEHFEEALQVLSHASRLSDQILNEKLLQFNQKRENNNNNNKDSEDNEEEEKRMKAELKEDLLYLQRMHWILRQHQEALEKFNYCLTLNPQSAHCLFRRGWSHKALGNYAAAGEDFENAKNLQPNDPNFALDYKKISKCEFMIVHSDPDLVEPFPSLLPVPGLQSYQCKYHSGFVCDCHLAFNGRTNNYSRSNSQHREVMNIEKLSWQYTKMISQRSKRFGGGIREFLSNEGWVRTRDLSHPKRESYP
eukprot:scaffold912_cov187-Ochromonas_danica.AAC.55